MPRRQDVNTNSDAQPWVGVYPDRRYRLLSKPRRKERLPLGGKGLKALFSAFEQLGQALLADHLKGHVHDQLAVVRGEAAEKLAEALEEFCRFTGAAPLVAFGRQARRERWRLGRRFPVVKKLVHGNFKSAGHFFQRLDARDGVAVFHTRDVAALEAGALLDVPLRKVFLLPDGA